ncbi:MAG TPA: CBS domain-containing protein, partial [Polyangia bacterium]
GLWLIPRGELPGTTLAHPMQTLLARSAMNTQPLVRDLMHSTNVLTITPTDSLALARQVMLWGGVRHLPVVADGGVVGILTERDILRQGGNLGTRAAALATVASAMTAPTMTIGPDEPVANAITLMVSRKLGCLPVVAANRLVGILTTTDVLRHDLETALEQPLMDRPPQLRAVMKPATPVRPETRVIDAAALMSSRCIRHLPVVDPEGKVVGILSDRDLRAAFGDPRRFLSGVDHPLDKTALVGDVMSRVVIVLNQNEPLTRAIECLVQESIGALPIVDDARHLVGILSYLDIIAPLRRPVPSQPRV